MERRGKRGAAVAEVRTTRASSKSPSRQSSASRNRSPARNASPARTKTSTTQRRSARNKITDNDTASETDDSKSDILTKVSIRVSPLKLDKDGRVSKTPSKLRTATSKSKLGNISNDGDDEVASLTAKYLNDKLNAGDNPTPSDLSTGKRSYSRSMSRSVIEDEDWTHSDTSEKNNDPLYGNRITRSRSKTQNRREHNLTNDAAAEFGGSLGAALLIVLLPILCFSAQYVCSRPECSMKSIRWEKLKLVSSYFTLEAGYLYLAFKWIVCAISIIPYLGVKRQLSQSTGADAQQTYYFNGFATAIAIVSGIGATEYYFKYPIITLIYKSYQQLCFISFVYALLISIWCFVRSAYFPVRLWNPYGKSGRLV